MQAPGTAAPQSWADADKTYQAHHFACRMCCAAGMTQGRQPRCEAGAKLWQAYTEAGYPPHITKPRPAAGRKP